MWWLALMTAQASSFIGCSYTGTVAALVVGDGTAELQLQVEGIDGAACVRPPQEPGLTPPPVHTFRFSERQTLVRLVSDGVEPGHRVRIRQGQALGYDRRGKPWGVPVMDYGGFVPAPEGEASCRGSRGDPTPSGQRGPVDACNLGLCIDGSWRARSRLACGVPPLPALRFPRGRADVRADHLPVVEQVVQILAAELELIVRVDGHRSAGEPHGIGSERAEAVRRALEEAGVAPERVAVRERGDLVPPVEGGRRAQQRVSLQLLLAPDATAAPPSPEGARNR